MLPWLFRARQAELLAQAPEPRPSYRLLMLQEAEWGPLVDAHHGTGGRCVVACGEHGVIGYRCRGLLGLVATEAGCGCGTGKLGLFTIHGVNPMFCINIAWDPIFLTIPLLSAPEEMDLFPTASLQSQCDHQEDRSLDLGINALFFSSALRGGNRVFTLPNVSHRISQLRVLVPSLRCPP
jgi:hypothetical protein